MAYKTLSAKPIIAGAPAPGPGSIYSCRHQQLYQNGARQTPAERP